MKTGWGVRNVDIDIALAVLSVVNSEGLALNCEEIADVCGCHRSRIEQIEKGALRKLNGRLHGEREAWR